MNPVAEIRKIYQSTSRATVARDLERAIALLKTLETEEQRERAAVYMDGLSQMRSEWKKHAEGAG
jgi:hypothetical protein